MANKRRVRTGVLPETDSSPSYWGFATVDSNGVCPKSRIPTANDAFTICWNLRLDNAGRERKWGRIYKCYKGFPPTDYSVVASKNLMGLHNVPFRQMKFIVDNQKSSFVDMVMERNTAANISTKIGNPTDNKKWGDLISVGFDRMLRYWNAYNYNVECDVEEMCLYGKGFEIAEDRDGWPTKSFHNSEVMIPDKTFADLTNLGEMCIKRSYTPLEFWLKISGGETEVDKAREFATSMGWNFYACVDAMRMFTTNYRNTYTNTEWLRDIASGNLNLSRLYTLRIELYELYNMEFDGSISKRMLLQNYGGLVIGYRDHKDAAYKDLTEDKYRDETGFLYSKMNWVEKDENGWEDIIAPMTDSTGSGIWHEIQGLADAIFIQCRQYDIDMNRILDCTDWSSRMMLEGGTAETAKKLKQMEWMPWMVLPEAVKPSQVSFNLPIGEILQSMQMYQNDMYRGIGAYSINRATNAGKQRTKGEAQLDAVESAKLQGTQIRRFNDNQTRWIKLLFKRMVKTTKGGNGYKLKERFLDFMEENGVPKEAYAWENIENIESNMLSGAGSPSFKLMAAQQTVALAGMTAVNNGQENAICDAMAALNGRSNVVRYRPDKKIIIPDDARVIAMENSGMKDPRNNPGNFKVFPEDNHVEHFKGHFSDFQQQLQAAQQMMQRGITTQNLQPLEDTYNTLMRFEGPHMVAHLQFIQKDPTKKAEAKQMGQGMQQIQRATDELGSQLGQYLKKKAAEDQQNGQQQSPEDVKLHALVATEAVKTAALQKREDIRTAALATKTHEHQRAKIETTATEIAVKRAKGKNDRQIARQKSDQELEAAKQAQQQQANNPNTEQQTENEITQQEMVTQGNEQQDNQ